VFAVCESCIKKCHDGHKVHFAGKGRGKCDCEKFSKCVALEEEKKEENNKPNIVTIDDALKNNVCTYESTKESYQPQKFYRCYTCGLTGNLGCCETCVNTCHKGHFLSQPILTNCFCDCGTKGTSCHAKIEKKEEKPTNPFKNHIKLINVFPPMKQFTNIDDSNQCTFKKFGKSYIYQPFYTCFTCNLTENLGFCEKCLNNCHKGHIIQYRGNLSAYCDCSEVTKNCKC